MRFFAGAIALLLTACWTLTAQTVLDVPNTDRLTYDIEWRMIHAGSVVVDAQKTSARMKLESAGMVSILIQSRRCLWRDLRRAVLRHQQHAWTRRRARGIARPA